MRAVMLVAGREIRSQVRSKGFVIGLLVTVLVMVGLTYAPKVFGGPDSYKIGLVASERLQLPGDVEVEWVEYPAEEPARRAVLAGEVDAVLVDGARVLTENQIDDRLALMLQTAHREAQIAAAGVRITPLVMEALSPDARYADTRGDIAFVLVLVLFMLIFGTPMMVAMGVVEEKSSRIVEILFAAVRPWQLLAGKVVGLGVIGLINLVVIVGAGLAGATASGLAVDFPPGMAGIVAGVVGWFVLGYLFFALCAAALGALVSRQEEVGSVMTPLTTVVFAAYAVAFYAISEPTGTVARVVSFIPPFSAMVMPVRTAAAPTPLWEVLVAAALMVAALVAMVVLGGKVYERAVLRTGARVRLREVLGSR